MILSPPSTITRSSQLPNQIIQQLPNRQFIQRPLRVGSSGGGGRAQTVLLQQPGTSWSRSNGAINNSSFGR